MTKSRRKHSICGATIAPSEKRDKQHANRVNRRAVNQAIAQDLDQVPQKKETSDIWSFAKDGKVRFDPAKLPRLARK